MSHEARAAHSRGQGALDISSASGHGVASEPVASTQAQGVEVIVALIQV